MPIRPVYDNTVESLQRMIRDLNDELVQIRSGNNRGQRSANAADAVQPTDLVTKRQFDILASHVRAGDGTTSRVPATQGGGGGGGALPIATHYIDYGYYFGKTRYDEIKGWTTGYLIRPHEDESTAPLSEWQEIMAQRLVIAAGDNKGITVDFVAEDDECQHVLEAIAMAHERADVWPHIKHFVFFDEPGLSADEIEAVAREIRDQVSAYNVPCPPLGVTLTKGQVLAGDVIHARGLDFIGVECYVDPPGSPDSQVNVTEMVEWIKQAKSLIPATKQIMLIMQGYNRNGAWRNETTLAALQVPVYLQAWDDPRVDQIMIFAWDRGSEDNISKGSRYLPLLQAEQQRIYPALIGSTTPAVGCSKQTAGAYLQDKWYSAFDLCITENFGTLFYNPGSGTYVIAGQESAAHTALLSVLNRASFGVTAIVAPSPPYNIYNVLMKPSGSTDYSELFAAFASSGKCRLDGGYIETCRPPKF